MVVRRYDLGILMVLAGLTGCGEGEATGAAPRAGGESDLALQPIATQAFPAGRNTITSPFEATIDPCQTSLQIVFGDVGEDLDAVYRDRTPPRLELTNGDVTINVEDGLWLIESVSFPLTSELLERMPPGEWSATVVVGEDVVAEVPSIVKLATGDANRDGELSSGDLVEVFEAGKYEKKQPAGYDQGDFNCDGEFDSGDLVEMYTHKEGIRYEGGAYVTKPVAVEERERWVVSDYQCWLAMYSPAQGVIDSEPAENDPLKDEKTWSHMEVDRTCSAPAYDPEFETPLTALDMTYADPSVASYSAAKCGFGDRSVTEANRELGDVGEVYSPGYARLIARGNASRDAWVMCEPRFESIIIDEHFTDVALDGFVIEQDDVCGMDLSSEAEGNTTATADAGTWAEWADPAAPGEILFGDARSYVFLRHPDLREVSEDEPAPLPGFEMEGTAQAGAPGHQRDIVVDEQKCVTYLLSNDWERVIQCFWNVVGEDVEDVITGGVDVDVVATAMEKATATAYLGWAKAQDDGEPDYSRPVRTEGAFDIRPMKDGPLRKHLGTMRAFSEQDIVSKAIVHREDSGNLRIYVTEAVVESVNGSVELVASLPPGDACRMAQRGRTFDRDDDAELDGQVIVERGRVVSVGVDNISRRYNIERDGDVKSFWEVFGQW